MGNCTSGGKKSAVDSGKQQQQQQQQHGKNMSFSSTQEHEDDHRAFNKPLDLVRTEAQEERLLADITTFNLPTIFQLRKIFDKVSSSQINDGFIDRSEFAQALGVDQSSLLCQRLFQSFDMSRQSRLSFREFVMALSVLSPAAARHEKLKFAFDLFDLNKDGFIDATELEALLVSAFEDARRMTGPDAFGLTGPQIKEICQRTLEIIDTDGNGVIDLQEFTVMVEQNPQVLAPFEIDVYEILDREFRRIQRMSSKDVSAREPLSRSRSPAAFEPVGRLDANRTPSTPSRTRTGGGGGSHSRASRGQRDSPDARSNNQAPINHDNTGTRIDLDGLGDDVEEVIVDVVEVVDFDAQLDSLFQVKVPKPKKAAPRATPPDADDKGDDAETKDPS